MTRTAAEIIARFESEGTHLPDQADALICMGDVRVLVEAAKQREQLLAACKTALPTMRVAVECGLRGFSRKKTSEIVENHNSVKSLREAIALCEPAHGPQPGREDVT